MKAEQYARHPTLARPFFRGMDAAAGGVELAANPYRRRRGRTSPRRGSWSEGFASAWASGWHSYRLRAADAGRLPAELGGS